MAGQPGRSGRKPKPGTLYHFYVRFDPTKHPPELKVILDRIMAARGQERQELIIAGLLGLDQADTLPQTSPVEDPEVTGLLDDMFGDW
jgi:hypothetical protein